ncbi:MAG: NAD-dependent DNA ligase LigA [Clostridiales bacterium]|nr:NAD-dependent DNA ligase LigA [Clostridiales bacterium]
MATDKLKKRIDELVGRLNDASKAYYDDAAEIMTNYEYDEMYDELLTLEAESGYIREDSPSINVGFETKTALPKVTHERKMLSLNKTKSRDELKAWLGQYTGLLSWKMDGLTVVLTYNNGSLEQAVTRGNGLQGELITANALTIKNLPSKISFKGKVVIRGEAVIKYSDFKKINDAIDDANAKYKNPRNLCSGSLRQLDPKVTAERSVYFYAFSLNSAEGLDMQNSRSFSLKWLEEQGFDSVEYVVVDSNNIDTVLNDYEKKIPNFDIPSDGLVLAFEDLKYSAGLGETTKFPRDAIAFKWRDQQAETVLREIEWSPSRTGLLNPIAIFDPVELEGSTLSRASVHNINIMQDLELGLGDTIMVYKANMIIPQISENLTRSNSIEIPRNCPVCDGDTEIRDENGTKTLICTNPDCIAKHVKRFSLFVSRDAMNIEGISEAGLLKLIGKGFLKSLPDIYDIEQHKDSIVLMEGFGEKSFANLISSIDKSRNTVPTRLLYSLGIPGIGIATSSMIAKASGNKWQKIQSLTEEDLKGIEGIGDIISRDYTEYFSKPENINMIENLLSKINLDESFKEDGKSLSGKTFVITGSLEHYENRKELRIQIEAEGGKIVGSVSTNTDYLITNDKTSGSSKNKKAQELGVKIISEDEIRAMLGV